MEGAESARPEVHLDEEEDAGRGDAASGVLDKLPPYNVASSQSRREWYAGKAYLREMLFEHDGSLRTPSNCLREGAPKPTRGARTYVQLES